MNKFGQIALASRKDCPAKIPLDCPTEHKEVIISLYDLLVTTTIGSLKLCCVLRKIRSAPMYGNQIAIIRRLGIMKI